jgi:hypothetical protein
MCRPGNKTAMGKIETEYGMVLPLLPLALVEGLS